MARRFDSSLEVIAVKHCVSLQILLCKERDTALAQSLHNHNADGVVRQQPHSHVTSGGFHNGSASAVQPPPPRPAPPHPPAHHPHHPHPPPAAAPPHPRPPPPAAAPLNPVLHQGFVIPHTPQAVLSQMALLGAANLKDGLLVQQHQNSVLAAAAAANNHFPKPFNGTTANFAINRPDNKQQVINEIAASLADVKPSVTQQPLSIATSNSYSDSGQPSPATSTTSITSQVLKMQAAAEAVVSHPSGNGGGGGGGGGDAFLSSVNDNGSDVGTPQDGGPFNVRVPSNMSNLSIDDSFLGTMTGGSAMQTGSGSFDQLFDGDSNMGGDYQQDLSLSPHSGFSIPESGNLTIAEQGKLWSIWFIFSGLDSTRRTEPVTRRLAHSCSLANTTSTRVFSVRMRSVHRGSRVRAVQ